MTAIKKPIDELAEYKLAAARFRAKLTTSTAHREREILPVNGRIYVDLSGTISLDHLEELYGRSEIDIPELRQARKEQKG
jgi:hypothetical protein